MTEEYKYILEAARAGGAVAKKYFKTELEIETKSMASDVRTKADVETEETIVTILESYFPNYNFYGEEGGKRDKGSEFTFVIDPIDGTNNFVMGIPVFAVSIALMQNGKSIFGVIYDPMLDQMYYAETGSGAFVNDRPIRVSTESDLTKSTLSYTTAYKTPDEEAGRIAGSYSSELHVKRAAFLWCIALECCLIASGKFEGMISAGLELYDFAAGKIILREAGATLTHFDGSPDQDTNPYFIVSNGTSIHGKLVEFAQRHYATATH